MNFVEKFKQVLELAKQKYLEEHRGDFKFWSGTTKVGNIDIYFDKSNGDVNGYCSIKKNCVEITKYSDRADSEFTLNGVKDPTILFDYMEWLLDIEKELNGEKIEEKDYTIKKDIRTFEVIKEVFIEKEEYKLKADILDKLLSKSKVILEN